MIIVIIIIIIIIIERKDLGGVMSKDCKDTLQTSYVAPRPPNGGSKTQNGRFPSKIALRLKKVCYKVSLCENCQRKVVRHSLA